MLELRQLSDAAVEQQVGAIGLEAMDGLYIDDVLAIVDRGTRNLPSYLDLYRKSVQQTWSPYELDFSRDREEWESLSPQAQQRRIWSMRLFFDGEQQVAGLLAPLVWAAPTKEIEAFVATQLADEVRHTVFFDRYWREVVGTSAATLDQLLEEVGIRDSENAAYNMIFRDWLPAQAQLLASEPDNIEATAKFVTVYHLVAENALFLTGMRYQLEGARRWGRTWGFYKGFTAATRDESRHVLFGVKYLQDLVRQDPERFAPIIDSTVREFAPLIEAVMRAPGKETSYFGGEHLGQAWPGYTPETLRTEMVDYAYKALAKRLHAIGLEVAV
ncbi:MAG: ribonucleotide-diphosphate reductase subunit beta [Terriglobales bacterium]